MMRTKTLALVLVGSLATVSVLEGCAAKASFQAGGGTAQPPPPPPPPPPAPEPAATPTPEPPAAPAPAAKSEAKVSGDRVSIPGEIEFDFGKATLKMTDQTKKTLEQVKLFLQQNPKYSKLRIEGHTDNVGTEAENLELSGQRALTVKNNVLGEGVAKDRIVAVGCGQGKPIGDNKTEEGRAKNRRTEFHIAEINGHRYMGHDPNGGCKPFE
jgi:OOP family OmpA-OmpF porin